MMPSIACAEGGDASAATAAKDAALADATIAGVVLASSDVDDFASDATTRTTRAAARAFDLVNLAREDASAGCDDATDEASACIVVDAGRARRGVRPR
jgi:hypothetical protein